MLKTSIIKKIQVLKFSYLIKKLEIKTLWLFVLLGANSSVATQVFYIKAFNQGFPTHFHNRP